MNRGEILARGVADSRALLARYLGGFDDSNHTAQAPSLPNHVAWCLGHCALTMHRAAERLDGQPLPESQFILRSDRGDGDRYGAESVSFASQPVGDRAFYPGLTCCMAIFDAACDRLANAAFSAPDAKLDERTKWGAGETTLESLVMRMIFHNGTHCGQITDLRRALKIGSIFR
jgi:hypothetical protein